MQGPMFPARHSPASPANSMASNTISPGMSATLPTPATTVPASAITSPVTAAATLAPTSSADAAQTDALARMRALAPPGPEARIPHERSSAGAIMQSPFVPQSCTRAESGLTSEFSSPRGGEVYFASMGRGSTGGVPDPSPRPSGEVTDLASMVVLGETSGERAARIALLQAAGGQPWAAAAAEHGLMLVQVGAWVGGWAGRRVSGWAGDQACRRVGRLVGQ